MDRLFERIFVLSLIVRRDPAISVDISPQDREKLCRVVVEPSPLGLSAVGLGCTLLLARLRRHALSWSSPKGRLEVGRVPCQPLSLTLRCYFRLQSHQINYSYVCDLPTGPAKNDARYPVLRRRKSQQTVQGAVIAENSARRICCL